MINKRHCRRTGRPDARIWAVLIGSLILIRASAQTVSTRPIKDCVTLAEKGRPAPLVVSTEDFPGVLRVAQILQSDIESVTGGKPEIITGTDFKAGDAIIIGTLGKSPLIDELVRRGKISTDEITGKWECTLTEVVKKPMPGVDRALVIAGSDKRGTMYGMFSLSKEIGVSPWVWWADVPSRKNPDLYVISRRTISGEPAVKYRGIFLNDEEPALGRWAVEKYGGFNAQFYEHVFELILRLKGNFLWPAMWWAAFSTDDPVNPVLADEMGIVMSTSHHEPMMRAHAEWRAAGKGAWNYETNAEELRRFWTEGIERMNGHESIVTLAMRGDGDMAMSEDTNIALLEKIVRDQRTIITSITGRDITETPQVWALYKEVQDYYDKGMRVPDDVTLLLCDDNWGNVRRLPKPDDPPRQGGYGMYYHFDFVGGPRSYKWLNVNPLARIWEQMHLCYRLGVDRIWLVNVGDLKPMELPISFFLDYAWNPDAIPAEQLPAYIRGWAGQQFGPEHAGEIADILTQYPKFNRRRTPELLSQDTYSLIHYREWETVVTDYLTLLEKAEKINRFIPAESKDAYYQLVLHPVQACANLNAMYMAVAENYQAAEQGRASADSLADRVKILYEKDAEITHYYNKVLAGGKWDNMMNQTHIGYTYWQQPEKNKMPQVKRIRLPETADMGVAVEGSGSWWPGSTDPCRLPEFDVFNRQEYHVELFNRGSVPFEYTIKTDADWLTVSPDHGKIDTETRIRAIVDWDRVPEGRSEAAVIIYGPGESVVRITAPVHKPSAPKPAAVTGFVESNGVVSMEAGHFTDAVETGGIRWLCIPDMGRTLSGMTPMPVTASRQVPGENCPRLDYRMHLFSQGDVDVRVFVCPTQNYNDTDGLNYAVSFDDEPPRMINIHVNDTIPDWKYPETWNTAVSTSIKIMTSRHHIAQAGPHVLKLWMVDPGIVFQKIVVDAGGMKPCYLGPPESYFRVAE
ncbi:glycosyl hydrolase 115 family protein [bacterium]|nr:glycosyl hydrolase 115 family protein [bacterium]